MIQIIYKQVQKWCNQITNVNIFNFQRLATSIEMLDLSHNNISECSNYLHCLVKLKKLNLSFNNLSTIPSLCDRDGFSTIEYLDLSYNNIESIESDRVDSLIQQRPSCIIHVSANCSGEINTSPWLLVKMTKPKRIEMKIFA